MRTTKTYILLWVILIISLPAISQTFTAEVDRQEILIGEQVKLTLKLQDIKSQEQYLKKWVNLPDTFNHFEIIERGKIDTVSIDRTVNYLQTITLTSFDSGQWRLPDLSILYENNFGSSSTLSATPQSINVLPVDVSRMTDYHDIKEILEVQSASTTWMLVVVILITILSIVAVYFLSKKRKRIVVEHDVTKTNQLPLEWALSSLNQLNNSELKTHDEVKQYYLQVTHICRTYFQMTLQQKALQKTTDEWMIDLQPLPIQQTIKASFFQLMRLADTVKFAKYMPPVSDHEISMESAKQMLKEVDQFRFANLSTFKPNK